MPARLPDRSKFDEASIARAAASPSALPASSSSRKVAPPSGRRRTMTSFSGRVIRASSAVALSMLWTGPSFRFATKIESAEKADRTIRVAGCGTSMTSGKRSDAISASVCPGNGGTSAAPFGALFGALNGFTATSGATYYNQFIGVETDVTAKAGTSALRLAGWQLVKAGPVQGTLVDWGTIVSGGAVGGGFTAWAATHAYVATNQVTNGTPLIAIYSPGFNLGFGGGGGMACFNSTVAMDDDTIVYNGTVAEGGGLMLMGGQYYMTNTIVAMDAGLAGSPDLYSPEDDIGFTLIEFGNNYGTTYYTGTPTTVVSGGYNFIGSTNAPLIINYPNAYPGTVGTNNVAFYVFTNHDQVGTVAAPLNPNLGLLYPYGGPTWTMQPQTGSPVIAAGNPVAHANYDQRGAPYERVFNAYRRGRLSNAAGSGAADVHGGGADEPADGCGL